MSAKVRVHGVDLARAIAVLGMIYAHLSADDADSWLGQTMVSMTDSLPSALFAVLAGVTLSLMGVRSAREGGEPWAHTRHRLLVRGVILVGIGVLMRLVQVSILVVLIPLGVAMALLIPAIQARTSTLVALVMTFLLSGPAVQLFFPGAMELSELFDGAYPLFAWLGYVLVGMLVHRLLLTRPAAQAVVLIVGVLGTTAGLWLRSLLGTIPLAKAGMPARYSDDPADVEEPPVLLDEPMYRYLSPEGHSGGIIDQLTCICFSLTVIMACLLLTRSAAVTRALYPLRAMGSMGLTVYVLHVLTASLVMGGFTGGVLPYELVMADYEFGVGYPGALVLTIVIAVGAAVLWKLRFRRGPLEELLNRAIDAATDRTTPGAAVPVATAGRR
ncbi:DUF418 domain-containing protein [Corynebacterium halotolerans]|uniref:DUF418 domain-containing protein n=1 Tax=Corynebacterium halotolerans TaxID=225326 RepID=UPI003CF37AE7